MDESKAKSLFYVAGAVFIILLGSTFTTLNFGKVFPDHDPDDVKKIESQAGEIDSLKNQLAEIEKKVSEASDSQVQLDTAQASVTRLESENAALKEAVELLRAAPPKVVERTVTKPVFIRESDKAQVASNSVVRSGDSMEKARAVFGRPEQVSDYGSTVYWYYSGSRKIVFEDRKVRSWDGFPIEP